MQRAVFIVVIFSLLVSVQSNEKTTSPDVYIESTSTSIELMSNTTDADNFTTEIVTIASPSINDIDIEMSCDVNSTNCTTSTKKASQDKKDNAKKTKLFKLTQEIEKYSSKRICSCDLQFQICDINCCCDKDCSYENKLVFEKCDRDENRFYDTRYCKYSTYAYRNNTPYEWEVAQNGLFCIVKSNLPASYSIHKELNLKSLEDANLQRNKRYSWSPLEINKTDTVFSPSARFHYGQNVWILKKSSVIQPFELPSSFVTSACLTKKPVQFLENFRAKCTHTTINEENNLLKLENFVENITIISRPELINMTWNETNFKSCPKNICVPLQMKICEKGLGICLTPTNIDKFKLVCRYSFYNNEKICTNVVHQIKYNIYHNGTYGISKVDAIVVLENVTIALKQNLLYLQKFEVDFLWINNTLNYSLIRSGNPGYIIGKPILVANLLATRSHQNSTSNNTNTLKRRHSDFTDSFMTFPSNKNGLCVLTNSTNTPVEFGYNMILKCKLKKQVELEKNCTAASVCKAIQLHIFNYWSIKVGNESANVTRLVGKFGNANMSDVKEWMAVAYVIEPKLVLNATTGQLKNKNTSLICNGIYTSFKVDLYHGREVVSDLHNQEKILWSTFRFENRRSSLEFEVDKGLVYFEVNLRMEVMFFDVTGEKVKKFVDPPALDIKLPYDFFYPFIKVSSNNCITFYAHFYLSLFCGIVLIIFTS